MEMQTDCIGFAARRTSQMQYHVPGPPRIVVPPPPMVGEGIPLYQSFHPLSPVSFLKHAYGSEYEVLSRPHEWAYEQRREAQLILPYLYLGPMVAARDETWLKEQGITYVLAIRQQGKFESRLMNGALQKAGMLGIEQHVVDLKSNQDLIAALPTTTALILDHLAARSSADKSPGSVFVFCESGNERSAAVVVAFLMETHRDVDHIRAIQHCQLRRFCINLDDTLKRLLEGYWDILQAKRVVGTQINFSRIDSRDMNGIFTTGNRSQKKRSRELDDEGDDEDEIMRDDSERFDGRHFSPFVDDYG